MTKKKHELSVHVQWISKSGNKLKFIVKKLLHISTSLTIVIGLQVTMFICTFLVFPSQSRPPVRSNLSCELNYLREHQLAINHSNLWNCRGWRHFTADKCSSLQAVLSNAWKCSVLCQHQIMLAVSQKILH